MLSVQLALLNAVQPKHDFLKSVDASDAEWLVWGKPKKIQTDSAKEFKCKAFIRGCQENHIVAKLRPRGNKHWGGRIERAIGRLVGEMHFLIGTTFSNVVERGDYDSEGMARMSLSGLRRWIVYQIGEYHNTPVSTLEDRTPMQVWTAGLTKDGVVQYPPLVGDIKKFEYSFLPTFIAKNRGATVRYSNRYYTDAILLKFPVKKLQFYYHPDRLNSCVYKDTLDQVLSRSSGNTERIVLSARYAAIHALKKGEEAIDRDCFLTRLLL